MAERPSSIAGVILFLMTALCLAVLAAAISRIRRPGKRRSGLLLLGLVVVLGVLTAALLQELGAI